MTVLRADGATSPNAQPAASRPAEAEGRRLPLPVLSSLALVLGVVTGAGAALFRDLIGLLHNLFFTGHLSLAFDANQFTAATP